MKITNENRNLFETIKVKHNLKKEGFLTNFFKKRLKKRLGGDVELQQALKDADKYLDDVSDYVKQMEKEGRPVPSYVKRYL